MKAFAIQHGHIVLDCLIYLLNMSFLSFVDRFFFSLCLRSFLPFCLADFLFLPLVGFDFLFIRFCGRRRHRIGLILLLSRFIVLVVRSSAASTGDTNWTFIGSSVVLGLADKMLLPPF